MFEVCGIGGALWNHLVSIPRRLFKDTLPLYRIIFICRCRICGLPGSAVAKLNRPLNLSNCCNFKHLHWTVKLTYGLCLIGQPPFSAPSSNHIGGPALIHCSTPTFPLPSTLHPRLRHLPPLSRPLFPPAQSCKPPQNIPARPDQDAFHVQVLPAGIHIAAVLFTAFD
jgi:hypothetical protein